jgi:hypothetical protein
MGSGEVEPDPSLDFPGFERADFMGEGLQRLNRFLGFEQAAADNALAGCRARIEPNTGLPTKATLFVQC